MMQLVLKSISQIAMSTTFSICERSWMILAWKSLCYYIQLGRATLAVGLEISRQMSTSIFTAQNLERAKILKPVKINAQSGGDYWSLDESVYFYQKTLGIDKELGLTGLVSHETHRNRSLFTPYAAQYILPKVPELRVTADISHWVVVCERLLDLGEEDREILDLLIPRVTHIHARIGTTQSSQCPEPEDPVFKEEREFFERLWLRIVKARSKDSDLITFVPEYGPYPYHPYGSVRTHGQVADSEGARLQKLFEDSLKE
ncbi:hypothetical protein FOXG_15740 [Fusarium oxysporum f. sp. lycopersici 4287]|uniref:Xylose isomerase-like TIM barrel domain-containing protein n=2 Tax=Fusarium oxysporum TaxID=5507 RepID=A0A0J9W5G0_FUSO4|nr:hypothetical protein FOXG_15740 [Fusarium oxysporum f. sp. lycopersici 4287]KNB18103.1 hypothetical protein FOXG_15740 [Fusarium oxysporum f. sp. lycopersici 4287]